MNLTIHLMTSIILGTSLFPAFGWKAVFVLIGGFFIDTDHYLFYLFKEKSFNLRNAYFYFKDKQNCENVLRNYVLPFHTMEALVVSAVLSLYFEIFLMVTVGMILHIILDWIYELRNQKNIKVPSIIFWYYKKVYKHTKSTF
ncbi:hypothetical protein HQ529_02705 [Candidatus Woesearchaeota archaeon]|nr:hypothetical protein [Candidatus Woesearchaeota archaeon]